MPFIQLDERRKDFVCDWFIFEALGIGRYSLRKLEELGVLVPVRMRFIDSGAIREQIVYDRASVRKAKKFMREKYGARHPRAARRQPSRRRDPVA